MSVSIKDNSNFVDCVIGSDLLGSSLDWIGDNLEPEDVFTTSDLEEWAYDNGFIKE